ncbi:hypothetical protein BpHYR1_015703 [Brachionus plicatilis]|uniref:Uncharacterized protein n=1 Tax=Brachionus plicatilis TaxID=10195 RepID=A0A3M7RFS6_BRAPC|nr:hypothetical protein BpHYR1_015703 [Brachionus plicatilis]
MLNFTYKNSSKNIQHLIVLGQKNDYVDSILKILNEIEYNGNFDVLEKCKYYKYASEMEHKAKKKDNIIFKELYSVFNDSNRTPLFLSGAEQVVGESASAIDLNK